MRRSTLVSLATLVSLSPAPACSVATRVDVHESVVSASRIVQTNSADELGILLLHPFCSQANHARVLFVDATVLVQIIIAAVPIVVYVPVHRVAVHMA